MDEKMYQNYKSKFPNEKYFSKDGIIDLQKFNSAPEKILWILKEPYGKKEKDFDYLNYINKFKFEAEKSEIYDTSSRMWHNITHVNYCIFNNKKWEEIDNCWENESVFFALHQSALINLKKVQGETTSNYNDIWKYYQTGKEIILQQIEIINPSVIICGGTFTFLYNDLKTEGLEEIRPHSDKQWATYRWKDRMLIDAYHPSARYDQEKYCNKITNAYQNSENKS